MEWLLAIATIIGGISAIWFFWDKFISHKNESVIDENPLNISFRAQHLDGAKKTRLTETSTESFQGGIKFYIIIHNIATQQVLLKRISCQLEKLSGEVPHAIFRKDASIIKFGNAVIPHRLFININDSNDVIWWLTQNSPNEDAKRLNGISVDNLLTLDDGRSLTFTISPHGTEQVEGALSMNKAGVYSLRFSFCYETPNGSEIIRNTSAINLHNSENRSGADYV